MTKEKFNELLNDIDDELIDRADKAANANGRSRKRLIAGIGVIAACLCLIALPIYTFVKYLPNIEDILLSQSTLPTVGISAEATDAPTHFPSKDVATAPTSPTVNATRGESPTKAPEIAATEPPIEDPTDESTCETDNTVPTTSDPDHNISGEMQIAVFMLLIFAAIVILFIAAPALVFLAVTLLRRK